VRLTSSQTWTIVGIASLIWLSLSIVGTTNGGGLSVVWSLKDVIPALLSGAWVYERWLWRFSPIHRVGLIRTPVVIGTWKGDLASFWTDPTTGERRDPKTVYLTIEQTATTVSVRLLTNESASEQVAGMMSKTEAGHPALSYTYRNRPELRFREGNISPIHYGSALLEIVGDPATALVGSYWGDRKGSRGEMRFTKHAAEIAQTFNDAERLQYKAPRPVGIPGAARLAGVLDRGRQPEQPTPERLPRGRP
jgi:SMODS-associating 2TM, beta-strand rich effector domain